MCLLFLKEKTLGIYRYKAWSDFSFASCGDTSVISAQWRVNWEAYRFEFSLGYLDSYGQALATDPLTSLKINSTRYGLSYNFSYNINHYIEDFQILDYPERLILKGHACYYLLVFHMSQPCRKWDPHRSEESLKLACSFLRNAFLKWLLPRHPGAEHVYTELFHGSAWLVLLHTFTKEATKGFWEGHPSLCLQKMFSLFP